MSDASETIGFIVIFALGWISSQLGSVVKELRRIATALERSRG